jgi:hypothetical protein
MQPLICIIMQPLICMYECIQHNKDKASIQKCADRVKDDWEIKLAFVLDDLLAETAKEESGK